jgi:hypothetical protein
MVIPLISIALALGASHMTPPPGCHVERNPKTGHILRSADALRAFRAMKPCPATGRTGGACPHYEVNHRIPLECCGPDTSENMEWLTHEEHVAFHKALTVCPTSGL